MKRSRRIILVALMCALIAGPSTTFALPVQDAGLPYNILIYHGYFNQSQLNAIAPNSVFTFTVSSTADVSTAFMNETQFASFNEGTTDLSSSLYLRNGTSAQGTLREPVGTYYLVIYAYGRTANVSYNYQVYPVNPFYVNPLVPPQPTGVASFGLYNQSGVITPYQVKTDRVVAMANVTALQAYNATASLAQSNVSGATLQLNSVLLVNESGGGQQVYWIQDTPDFVTGASQIAFADNVWNFSVSGYLDNSTVTSADGGAVFSYPDGPSTGYYYSYETGNYTYALPFELALVIDEMVQPGHGVVVRMGAQLTDKGLPLSGPVDWFDTVTIHDPTAQSACFFVSGNQTTPNGLFYDTELVWGGETNGESTNFTQMSSSLGLYYENYSSGAYVSFPSLYTFGGDTAEAAFNLNVSYSGKGTSLVNAGTPGYRYLGTTSGSFSFPFSISTLNSSSITSSNETSASSSATASASQLSTTSVSTSGSNLALPSSYVALLLVTSLVAGAALARASSIRMKGSRALHRPT